MRFRRLLCTALIFPFLFLTISCSTAKTDTVDNSTTNTTETVSESTTSPLPSTKPIDSATLPRTVYGTAPGYGHVQGIAIDTARKHMYFSFGRCFVKTDMQGNVIGSIEKIDGHLGDLAYNDEDGLVYASYVCEDTNDFYIAIIDVSKVDRVGLKTTTGNIFSVVSLPDVAADYTAFSGENLHRYGCSGIDGISFGPVPGAEENSPSQLMVAYGIFSDVNRTDNDYQVLLQFDWKKLKEYKTPYRLVNNNDDIDGPTADKRYFVYTGNTVYGIQNLTYDPSTNLWLIAVYNGQKSGFPNYELYAVDAAIGPVSGLIEGQPTPTMGLLLTLADMGLTDDATGLRGWYFDCDGRGMLSLGDGYFYITDPASEDGTADAKLYCWVGGTQAFEPVK